MHNVHSCVMGGSKWDSWRSLLFCFNDLLFHLVLKIRMEDLFRFFFSFRKCTCWQSIPLGYDLECVTSSTAKLLNSSFNNNGIPHLPLEHFPPALPYWCCTSCFCGEREKKEWKKKYNEWVVISVKDSINIMSPIVLSFWPYVTWNTNDEQCIFHSVSRPQSANSSLNKHSQCLPIQFFFFSFSLQFFTIRLARPIFQLSSSNI